jgi:hypothetical protein
MQWDLSIQTGEATLIISQIPYNYYCLSPGVAIQMCPLWAITIEWLWLVSGAPWTELPLPLR